MGLPPASALALGEGEQALFLCCGFPGRAAGAATYGVTCTWSLEDSTRLDVFSAYTVEAEYLQM